MVAFSCCVFDGGDDEKKELDAAREKGWKGKFTRPGRVIRPGAIRMNGKCPLTPLEVLPPPLKECNSSTVSRFSTLLADARALLGESLNFRHNESRLRSQKKILTQ
jgi:hypothetical protein